MAGRKKKRINFIQFFVSHQEEIFGKVHTASGKSCLSAYEKQIVALDIKMNELIRQNGELTKDPLLLLGLFEMAVSQFGVTVKTDSSRYRDDFLLLVASESEKEKG